MPRERRWLIHSSLILISQHPELRLKVAPPLFAQRSNRLASVRIQDAGACSENDSVIV